MSANLKLQSLNNGIYKSFLLNRCSMSRNIHNTLWPKWNSSFCMIKIDKIGRDWETPLLYTPLIACLLIFQKSSVSNICNSSHFLREKINTSLPKDKTKPHMQIYRHQKTVFIFVSMCVWIWIRKWIGRRLQITLSLHGISPLKFPAQAVESFHKVLDTD